MTEHHDAAEMAVSWALGRAYKIAVHQCGITDWSEYGPMEKSQMDKHVETLQVGIAGILLDEVNRQIERSERSKS